MALNKFALVDLHKMRRSCSVVKIVDFRCLFKSTKTSLIPNPSLVAKLINSLAQLILILAIVPRSNWIELIIMNMIQIHVYHGL